MCTSVGAAEGCDLLIFKQTRPTFTGRAFYFALKNQD
jgi:hypothetical protein